MKTQIRLTRDEINEKINQFKLCMNHKFTHEDNIFDSEEYYKVIEVLELSLQVQGEFFEVKFTGYEAELYHKLSKLLELPVIKEKLK